jgi:hypothetical protein
MRRRGRYLDLGSNKKSIEEKFRIKRAIMITVYLISP